MRLVDIQLSLPAVLIALAVLALSGRGLWKVIAVIGIVGWAHYVLAERQQDYVIAAILAGGSGRVGPAWERAGASGASAGDGRSVPGTAGWGIEGARPDGWPSGLRQRS